MLQPATAGARAMLTQRRFPRSLAEGSRSAPVGSVRPSEDLCSFPAFPGFWLQEAKVLNLYRLRL